ncbi:hypothetical protein IAT38_000259 [Cryptococcus sp. DSM 104549]
MLLRRLYSSATTHRSCLSSSSLSHLPTASASSTQTRGRVPRLPSTLPKPKSKHSLSTSAVAKPARHAGALQGKGRKPRRSASISSPASASASATASSPAPAQHTPGSSYPSAPTPALMQGGIPRPPRLSFTHPQPALNHANEFRPIYLYPEQFKLHATFTKPGMPLPLHLGTKGYTTPSEGTREGKKGMSWEELFSAAPQADAASPSVAEAPTPLGEHLSTLSMLSPELTLSQQAESLGFSESLFGTPELEMATIPAVLEGKAAELRRENEIEWGAVVEKMEGALRAGAVEEASEAKNAEMKDAEMKEVVGELADVLARLGMGVGAGESAADGVVEMDSTKRKRRKKVTKHKYKKKRKANRALRKRLGK